MNVLVDTSIWSLALRRAATQNPVLKEHLIQLIDNLEVRIIGPVRQELLSGIKIPAQFETLKLYLSYFPDIDLQTADFELAAHFFNLCRKGGIQGSNTDILICAVAFHNRLEIFASDSDFVLFSKVLPIKLHRHPPGMD